MNDDKLPKSIQELIKDTNKAYDSLINDIKDMDETTRANRSAAISLSLKDLEELSMMVTRTKCIAMKLSIGHRDSNATAMDDKNYSLRLQRFSQHLQEIHDFYAKEH